MLYNKKIEWIAFLGVLICIIWFLTQLNYESLGATISSVVVWLGYRLLNRHSLTNSKIALPQTFNKISPSLSLPALLESAYISDRPRIIRESLQAFPFITPSNVITVLELLYISDRPKALSELAPIMEPPPSDKEVKEILDLMYVSNRPGAAKILAQIHKNKWMARTMSEAAGDKVGGGQEE